MNPSLTEPPAQAACTDADEGIRLAMLYQNVTQDITGKARWLGRQSQLKTGKNHWLWAFKKLAGQLRIWKFDAEQFLRWAVSTYECVIEYPSSIASDWLMDKYNSHRQQSMADAAVEDKVVRGKLDLIRARMIDDVEFLAGWVKFQPDYRQRLLNQYHALSPHFLATDVIFLCLMKEGLINQKAVAEVNVALVELNNNKWFYQQVRSARDTAIVDAGK